MGAGDAIRTALGYQAWSAGERMVTKVKGLLAERGDQAEREAARRAGRRLSYELAFALAVPS